MNYYILETLEAGLVLSGEEVKSVRLGRVDLSESFAKIQKGEIFLKNAYIYPYASNKSEYNPNRDRKLLLHRSQIDYLLGKTSKTTMTLVPLEIYSTRNLIKVHIALASPKKKYDHRKAIKERDELRKLEQELGGR